MGFVTILGTDVLVCVLTTFVMVRLKKFIPFSYMMLRNVCIYPPTSDTAASLQLMSQGGPIHKRGPSKKRAAAGHTEKFMPFRYMSVKILYEHGHLNNLPFYAELEMLLMFACMVGVMVGISEVGHCLRGPATYGGQIATSVMLLWTFVQSASALFKLLARQWTSDTRLSLYVALLAFPTALLCLYYLCDPGVLDFPIERSVGETKRAIEGFLEFALASHGDPGEQGPEVAVNDGPISPSATMLRALISVPMAAIAAALSGLLFLPAVRFARCYFELVDEDATDPTKGSMVPGVLRRALLHSSFFLPLVLMMCWITPLTGEFMLADGLVPCARANQTDDASPILATLGYSNGNRDCLADSEVPVSLLGGGGLNESSWWGLRLVLTLAWCVLQLCLVRVNVGTFAESGLGVVKNVMREPKRYDPNAVQQKLVVAYSHTCVATLQYVAPVVCAASVALLTSRWGGQPVGFCDAARETLGLQTLAQIASSSDPKQGTIDGPIETLTTALIHTNLATPDSLAMAKKYLDSHLLVPHLLLRTVFSFLVWWFVASWFLLNTFGVVYWASSDGEELKTCLSKAHKIAMAKRNKKKGD